MGKKPGGDLGTMGISKDQAAAAVPFVPVTAAEPATSSVVTLADKSLTVKLKGELYEALRDYCHGTGKATGTRVTHQEVMVEALRAFLRR